MVFQLCVSVNWKCVSCLKNQSYWFLINYTRKNAKYFSRKFIKRNCHLKLTYLKSNILLMSHFRERLVSLNVIDKTQWQSNGFLSHQWIFSLRLQASGIERLLYLWRIKSNRDVFNFANRRANEERTCNNQHPAKSKPFSWKNILSAVFSLSVRFCLNNQSPRKSLRINDCAGKRAQFCIILFSYD